MGELKTVNIDELKVGDVVGYCKYVSYSWGKSFRYPIITPKTITRITPKRTKFVVDGMELDTRKATRLVIVDEESKRQTVIAKLFYDIQQMSIKFDALERREGCIKEQLTDDELLEVHAIMKKIYESHNVEEVLNQCK